MVLDLAFVAGIFCLGVLCGAGAIIPSWLKEVRDRKRDIREIYAFEFGVNSSPR
ncbi:MAG: hypothetical protein MRY59_09195 [Aquisalinus sp.]|nr:hypothetical protein [Aquisalinus sp.]